MTDIFAETNRQLSIKEVVQKYAGVSFNNNKQCCCPLHSEKTPSFTIYPDTNTFKCYGCGVSGDCVGFVAKLKNLGNIDAVRLLHADFGLRLDLKDQDSSKPKRIDFRTYLEQCKKDIGRTSYFQSRGLSEETIKRFNLGYDEKRNQVVIPYNRKLTYYQARSIAEKKFYKPKNEDAGSEPIYNEDLLSERNVREPIFIVESAIDAMSVMQLGARAVATCGGSAVNKFAEKIKHLKPKPAFIISLDNDPGGITATKELCALFGKEKIKHIAYSISGKAKDPNELLMQNPAELKANIQKAREQFFRQTTTFGDLVPLTEIMATKFPPKNWLIKGLMSDGLYMLLASPKAGKSFLALDMCLSIASGEQFLGFDTTKSGVWYMAMEDKEESIQERTRKLWKGKPIPASILISHNDQHRIKTDGKEYDPDSVVAYIENALYIRPDIKFIVIDTLQLIRGEEKRNENIYKADYRELRVLKRFVDEKSICIMFIHHTRKGKDEGNEFNEASGSTAITGCVDAVFKITKKNVNDSEAKFSVLARSIFQEPLAIYFDRENCKWIRIGTEKEQAEQKAKEDYLRNDFRKTIMHLLESGGGTWIGTMSELVEEVGKLLGHSPAIVQPTQVSKEIHRLAPLLSLHDGICHSEPNKHGGKFGRKHWFCYKHKEVKQQVITV